MSQIPRDANSAPIDTTSAAEEQPARQARWGLWSLGERLGRKDAGARALASSASPAFAAAQALGDDDAGSRLADAEPARNAAEDFAWSDDELEQMQRQEDEICGVVDPSRRADLIHASMGEWPNPNASRSGWGLRADEQGGAHPEISAVLGREAKLAQKAREKASEHANRAGLRVVENPAHDEALGPNDFVLFLAQLDDVATAAGPMGASNRPLAVGALKTHEAWAAMPRALRSAADPHSMSLGLWLAQARARAAEAGSGAIVFCGVDTAEEDARQALRVAMASLRQEQAELIRAAGDEEAEDWGRERISAPGASRAWVGVAGDESAFLGERA